MPALGTWTSSAAPTPTSTSISTPSGMTSSATPLGVVASRAAPEAHAAPRAASQPAPPRSDRTAPFVHKLRALLTTCPPHVGRWSADGTRFEVLRGEEFAGLVCDEFAKGARHKVKTVMRTFARQLQFYAFKKTSLGHARDAWALSHPYFVRDDVSRQSHVRRYARAAMREEDSELQEALEEFRGHASEPEAEADAEEEEDEDESEPAPRRRARSARPRAPAKAKAQPATKVSSEPRPETSAKAQAQAQVQTQTQAQARPVTMDEDETDDASSHDMDELDEEDEDAFADLDLDLDDESEADDDAEARLRKRVAELEASVRELRLRLGEAEVRNRELVSEMQRAGVPVPASASASASTSTSTSSARPAAAPRLTYAEAEPMEMVTLSSFSTLAGYVAARNASIAAASTSVPASASTSAPVTSRSPVAAAPAPAQPANDDLGSLADLSEADLSADVADWIAKDTIMDDAPLSESPPSSPAHGRVPSVGASLTRTAAVAPGAFGLGQGHGGAGVNRTHVSATARWGGLGVSAPAKMARASSAGSQGPAAPVSAPEIAKVATYLMSLPLQNAFMVASAAQHANAGVRPSTFGGLASHGQHPPSVDAF